jgi:hypothetical protein
MSSNNPDRQYFNVKILNPPESDDFTKRASFKETRSVPVLENPSKFEMAVARFKIPTSGIPLLITDNFNFTMSLDFNGTTISTNIVTPPSLGTTGPYGPSWYSYNNLSDAFNLATQTIFNDMIALEPTLPGEAPFMEYDPTTLLYRTYYSESWNETLPNPPRLRVNTEFARLIISYRISYNANILGNDKWIFRVQDYNSTNIVDLDGTDYILMVQENTTTNIIPQFSNVILSTSRIPVAGEFVSDRQVGDNLAEASGSLNTIRSMVTDFEPIQDIFDRSYLQFFPQGSLRYYPLQNTNEMRTIDIDIFWEDYTGRIYPLYLQPGDSCSVKLEFRRKGMNS